MEPGDYIAPDTRPAKIEASRHYYAYLRGDAERPLTRLADTRPLVRLCSLTYVAAGRITAVPAAFIQRSPVPDGQGEWVAIAELDKIAEAFLTEGLWPERQSVPWGIAGGQAAPADLHKLNAVVKIMLAESRCFPELV